MQPQACHTDLATLMMYVSCAGDRLLKRYVVAMPDLEEQQLSSQDDALILASDGLWDVLSNEDAATLIREIKVSPCRQPLPMITLQMLTSCTAFDLHCCAACHLDVDIVMQKHRMLT